MPYIYHIVPENLKGKTLYPLNQLKHKYPSIYREAVKKYKDREEVLRRKIPLLNCYMLNVLHFSIIHPKEVTKAIRNAGYPLEKSRWFKINTKELNPKRATIYLFKHKKNEKDFMSIDNFTNFVPSKINNLKTISKRTIDYYRKSVKEGKRPLKFLFVPHLMYKSSLDISKTEIIKAYSSASSTSTTTSFFS